MLMFIPAILHPRAGKLFNTNNNRDRLNIISFLILIFQIIVHILDHLYIRADLLINRNLIANKKRSWLAAHRD